MHGLIDDILELTAIEGGNVQLRQAPVRLSELINEVIGSLTDKASPHRISLVNSVPANVVVRADARRLERMVTNLIDNGIKFGSEGGTVTVKVRVEPSAMTSSSKTMAKEFRLSILNGSSNVFIEWIARVHATWGAPV
jgi:signal transduction histidine kinase